MTKTIFRSMVILTMIMVAACSDDNTDLQLQADEERYFQLYMDANYPDLTPNADGLYKIEYKEGDGLSPDSGDYVLVNYIAYTLPDEVVVDTYVEDWAVDNNIYTQGVLYGPYKYQHGAEMEGMRQGVASMKEGGIVRLIFMSDLGYGSNGLGKIGSYKSLMYDLELVEVIGDPSGKEFQQMMAYLAEQDSYITHLDDNTDTEMYYIEDEPGEGDNLGDDDEVEIRYTGKLLDGRVFDTNVDDASGLTVIIGNDEVIPGWEIGLKYFKRGGSGRLLIPHPLAYGEEGSYVTGTTKTSIPPFEALLFEIEIAAADSITE